jgi:hypothetical protein
MSKMRLGAIKVFEECAYLTSLCRTGEDTLGDICSRLAADHINLSLMTHIADNGVCESITAACTKSIEGFSSYIEWKASHGKCSVGKLQSNNCIISIFPHYQKLNVTGTLMGILAGSGIRPYGFASSPSAMTMIVSSSDFQGAIEGLFDAFEFSSYRSPWDWRAAYRSQEKLVKEVSCSYREQSIKIYEISHRIDLDLWNITLPLECLGNFGAALLDLNELGIRRMPFLVSSSSPDAEGLYFAFSFGAVHREKVRHALDQNLPGVDRYCLGPVSVFFLHGPHFGDRYGIANALVRALQNAGIPPLGLSCTMSSITAVIQGSDSKQTISALNANFQVPAGKS